jgi:hypothetical protein
MRSLWLVALLAAFGLDPWTDRAGSLQQDGAATTAGARQVTKDTVPGITNLARLETTVACAGAIKPDEAVPEIRKMGFVSIINLREDTEPGAEIDKEACGIFMFRSTAARRIRRLQTGSLKRLRQQAPSRRLFTALAETAQPPCG